MLNYGWNLRLRGVSSSRCLSFVRSYLPVGLSGCILEFSEILHSLIKLKITYRTTEFTVKADTTISESIVRLNFLYTFKKIASIMALLETENRPSIIEFKYIFLNLLFSGHSDLWAGGRVDVTHHKKPPVEKTFMLEIQKSLKNAAKQSDGITGRIVAIMCVTTTYQWLLQIKILMKYLHFDVYHL